MGNRCFTGAPKDSPRDDAPALLEKVHDPSFKWNVYGFSALLERGATSACSASFHRCGCNWFLVVTPSYKNRVNGIRYVALDLALSRIGFKPGHIMNAVFELSVYNHSSGTYYGTKASYSFHVNNTHSKKMCLVPLQELLKSSDHLVDDSCVFGVRILKADILSPEKKRIAISKKPATVQNLFLQKKDFIKGTYTWTMSNYLNLKLPVNSPAFEIGGHKWFMNMHPLGDKYSTESLSLFLYLHNPKELPDPESGMMIELTVSILDEKHGQNFVVQGRFVFAAGNKNGWGWSNFIPLKTFKDPSRGYLVGSNCTLKADITIIGSSSDC
ncbi:hypothetical protein BS78_01G203000 [Paspalum vaginatum]|nr:hypothetical protein BS78_01G203000 [Paspalum vaginatum]